MLNSKIFKTDQTTDDNGVIHTKITTSLKARTIAQNELNASIAQNISTLEADKIALTNLEQKVASGIAYEEAYAQTMNKASITAKEYAVQTQGLAGSTETFIAKQQAAINTQQAMLAQMQSNTVATKAATIATRAFSTALNMIAFALIAKGIQLAADAIDHYVNRAKYAAEAMEEAQQKIDDAQKSLKDLSITLEENKERFLELSKGVDRFSRNISLSEEEYSEYLSISQKLAELSPSLVSGYDEQGNALLDIGNSAEETTEKLNGMLETQQAIAQQTLIDNMDEVADGIYYEVEKAKDNIGALQNQLNNLTNTNVEIDIKQIADKNFGRIEYVDDGSIDEKYYKAMENALTSAGIKFEKEGFGSSKFLQIREASVEQLELAQKFYDAALEQEKAYYSASKAGLQKDIQEQEKIISNAYSKMSANLQAWVKDNYNYQYLSDSMQGTIDAIIPQIDWASMGDNAPKTPFEYQDYIVKNFIDPLMKIPEEHKEEINSMFQKLLEFEDGDIDIVPFAQYLQNELEKLNIKIKITPLISDEQTTYNNLQKSMSDFAQKASKATDGEITSQTGRYSNYKEIYNKINDFAQKYEIDTIEEVKAFDEALTKANGDIEKAFEYYLNEEIETLSSTEILSEVEKLSAGLDQLDKIYADVYDKEDFDWSSILNNEDFTKEFGNMTNVTDDYKDAYDNFIKTVSSSSDDLDACQSAFDDLATAYIYNSGVLNKVTEETKNATIAFLEQKGVVNAEEIVVASLTAKKEAEALKEQALAITKDEVTAKTKKEIDALLEEANASEVTKNCLFQLITNEQVFNNTKLDVNGKIKSLEALAKAYSGTAAAAAMSARLAYMKDQAEKSHIPFNPTMADIKDLQDEIYDAVYKPIEVDYGGGSATKSAKDKSSKDSGSKPSEVTQEFNWIEKYLESFARKTEKIMNRISDYLSFKKNLSTIKSSIQAVRSELSANEKALAEYERQMASVGLSQTYIDKIKNGELSIETITGYETDGNKDANAQLIEKIEKYQDLYDKYTEIEDKIEELRDTEKEWLVKNLEYINEYYQKLSDIKNLAIDKKQDNIDLKEAQGKKVTTSDYKKLVSYNEDYIKSLRTTYKKTNAEFNKLVKNGTIEKNSAEWFNWKESLADLNSEIVQAQINTAEWKDEINQMKIDSYTSSLDRLEAKYDKLNTTISRKESSNIIVTRSDYNRVLKNLDQQIAKNNKLLSLYKQLQSQTQKNSEKWREYQELIEQTEANVESLRDSIIETGQKMADIITTIRDKRLEDNQNQSNLLSAKYDNATSATERNKNLDEQDKLAKKNVEINKKAVTDSENSLKQLDAYFKKYAQSAKDGKKDNKEEQFKTSQLLAESEKDYATYHEKYLKAEQKFNNAKTKKQKANAKAEMEKYDAAMKSASTSSAEYRRKLEDLANADINIDKALAQLNGYEFGKEIDLSQITDEKLLEKASEWNQVIKNRKQAYIDAGLSEEEAIKKLRENASQRIQNCLDEYEALGKLNKAQRDNINSKISLNKKQGYTISVGEYETYIKSSQESIKLAQQKVDEAQAEFDKNLASGVYKDNEELYLKDKATLESARSTLYELWSDSESMLDEIMQLRIDALTEEKEAIQKLYDLQQRRYKLEEAQYNLEKAKQRTNLVYNGTEFVYQADTNALKEAEKALEDAKRDELINKIDDWIDALEDAKEDFNLYDAEGNPLGSTEDIIKAAKTFSDNLLDGLTQLLTHNGLEYSDGEIKQIQTFADGGVVGKSKDNKFDEIAKALGEDRFVAVKDGEMILTKVQSDELYKSLVGNAPTPVMDLKPIIPENLTRVNNSPISIDMSGMQFNEVQNMDQFTKEIQMMARKASSMIDMELGKRKM